MSRTQRCTQRIVLIGVDSSDISEHLLNQLIVVKLFSNTYYSRVISFCDDKTRV